MQAKSRCKRDSLRQNGARLSGKRPKSRNHCIEAPLSSPHNARSCFNCNRNHVREIRFRSDWRKRKCVYLIGSHGDLSASARDNSDYARRKTGSSDERRLRPMGRDNPLTIPESIHTQVTSLPEEDRQNRGKVNEAVRRYRANRPEPTEL